MWDLFTVDRMDFVSAQWFLPLILIIDYSLFAYLLVFYWKRRREPRVRLLLFVGWLSVAILLPYARSDHEKVTHLNDISESSGILAFLIQITIVGRDLNKKIKFRSILLVTYVAEILVVTCLATIFLTIADEIDDRVFSDEIGHRILKIMEDVNLAVVVGFRFYCIAAANGWRDIVQNRRHELICYLLFATSDVPFLILNAVSGLNWDAPQALYNRLTIAACLFVVTRSKIRKDSSTNQSVYLQTQPSTSLLRVLSTGTGGRKASILRMISVRRSSTQRIYATGDGHL